MTDPRETLARIRKQANAATEGPWEVKPYKGLAEDGDYVDSIVGSSQESIVYQLGCGCCDIGLEVAHPDAEFIAAARTDVPWLLEQVGLRDKALEAVLELHKDGGESQGYLDDGSYGDMPHCCTECGSLGEYGVPYPCPTVTAITTALNGDDQ